MSRKLLALAIANLTSSVNSIESSSVWLGSQQAYDTLPTQPQRGELRALMVKGKTEAVLVHVFA